MICIATGYFRQLFKQCDEYCLSGTLSYRSGILLMFIHKQKEFAGIQSDISIGFQMKVYKGMNGTDFDSMVLTLLLLFK